jgi:hypothetical protein
MTPRRQISVYARHDGWYINAMSQTTTGLYISTPPYLREYANISSQGLGEAALLALSKCQFGVPHPTEWDHLLQPILDLAGVRTWTQFMRDVPSIDADYDEEEFVFRPTKNYGPKQEYGEATAKPIRIPKDSSPELIGEMMRAAIALCE